MSVLTLSPLITDLRGSVKSCTFSKSRGVNLSKARADYRQTPNEKQFRCRFSLRMVLIMWQWSDKIYREMWRQNKINPDLPTYQDFMSRVWKYAIAHDHFLISPTSGNMPEPWHSMGVNQEWVYFRNSTSPYFQGQFTGSHNHVRFFCGGIPCPSGTKIFIFCLDWTTNNVYRWITIDAPYSGVYEFDLGFEVWKTILYFMFWNELEGWVSGTMNVNINVVY